VDRGIMEIWIWKFNTTTLTSGKFTILP
jgi:hypothetical protein